MPKTLNPSRCQIGERLRVISSAMFKSLLKSELSLFCARGRRDFWRQERGSSRFQQQDLTIHFFFINRASLRSLSQLVLTMSELMDFR